jgi:predicted kinase
VGDLFVIRGNSGAGKSTVARQLRLRIGRGCALVEQDYLRRILLREHGDVQVPIAPELIDLNARFALAHGYHVIVEGILDRSRYGAMLGQLIRDHGADAYVYYLDVSYDESVRRHATRPQATEFTAEQMRAWYRERDLLGVPGERVIPESTGPAEILELMARAR